MNGRFVQYRGLSIKMANMIDVQDIKKTLNRVANAYDSAAVLQREVADRLFERLDLMRMSPAIILDCGARTGYTTQLLKKRYRQAQVIALEGSKALLAQIPRGLPWRRTKKVCSDYTVLPFADHSVDFIFSNLTLHWSSDIGKTIQEFQRILKPNGLLLFSTVGPDTLKELRESFDQVDRHPHVHSFLDMHDVGDLLMQARFSDPVMDMENISMRYSSIDRLCQDLKRTGTKNALVDRRKGLMGKQAWQRLLTHYDALKNEKNEFPVTIELIYGHAWGAELKSEVVIPIDSIQKRGANVKD